VNEWGVTRRRVLATGATGLALAGLAGCGLFGGPEPPPAPDPLTPLRDAALALAATYDRTIATRPGLRTLLAPIAAAHRAHAAELDRILRPATPAPAASSSAPTAAPTGDRRTALADLRAAERQAQKDAAAACHRAPAERAALVGSIAAARACHAEALR
jgi:sugar phosphate isomerase/epimerase